jgi:hypothetical protein
MRRAAGWALGFARFWYRFVVGDDWTMAAAVVVALAVTALLTSHRVTAWWLVPAVVVLMVGVSLLRGGRGRPRAARVRDTSPSERRRLP